MKNIPLFFQVFVYMISLTILILGVVFFMQKTFVPVIYQKQIQSDMQSEIQSLDALLRTTDEENRLNVFNDYQLRQTYDINVYNIFGEELFNDAPVNLRTSTVITLNEKPIEDTFYDGFIPYTLRLEKKDAFIYKITIPTEGLYQTIDAIDTLYFYIVLSGLVVSLFTAFIFSRNIAKPINQLKAMSEDLGKKSLRLERKDEIGALSVALETLRSSLYETIDKLQKELKREKSQDVISKRFVANVSHEYQTPLAVMMAAIETLSDHINMSNDEKRKYFDMIQHEAKHLENLSKDILLLSKIPMFIPRDEKTYIKPNIDNVIEKMRLIHQSIEFHVDIPNKPILIEMSDYHFTQILTNLIDNAIAHGTSNEVMIKLAYTQKQLKLEISNEANIMNETDLPHLFDAFYKASSSGHGLGLAIVKGILDAYHMQYDYTYKENVFTFYIQIIGDK